MDRNKNISNAATHCASGEKKGLHAIVQFEGDKVIKIIQDFESFYAYNLAWREIKIGLSVEHPNLVSLEDYNIHFQRLEDGKENPRKIKSILIKYTNKGESLTNFIYDNHKFFFPKMIKVIMFQIFRGLAYLHKSKIIHRDLHPGNVLINNKLEVNIIDYGLARPFTEGKTLSSRSKRYFHSPEFHNNIFFIEKIPDSSMGDGNKYNEKMDIFSAGLIFYKVVTKNYLYRSSKSFKSLLMALMKWFVHKKKSRPSLYNDLVQNYQKFEEIKKIDDSTLCPLGKDLMMKCLLVEPKNRPSALEVLQHPYFQDFNKNIKNEYKNYKKIKFSEDERNQYMDIETTIESLIDMKKVCSMRDQDRKQEKKDTKELESLQRTSQTDREKKEEVSEKIEKVREQNFRSGQFNSEKFQHVGSSQTTLEESKIGN